MKDPGTSSKSRIVRSNFAIACVVPGQNSIRLESSPCCSPKLRNAMILIHVTCYRVSLYVIHFKRLLNFGEGQDRTIFYAAEILARHNVKQLLDLRLILLEAHGKEKQRFRRVLDSVAERLQKVNGPIIRVLKANRQPKQVLWNRRRYSFSGRTVFDKALHATQARRILKELYFGSHAHGFVPAAFYKNRKHSAKTAHLPGRDVVPEMRRQSRIENLFDFPGLRKGLRDRQSIRAVTLHAARQRAQPAKHKPRVKRGSNGAQNRAHVQELFVELLPFLEH